MNLKFTNANPATGENEYPLSKGFLVQWSAYKRRTSVLKRYGQDGGIPAGDNKADTRDITITYVPAYQSDADYLAMVNTLVGFFNPDYAPFYLEDTDNNRRCQLVLNQATDDAYVDGLELRIGKNSLKLEMLDAHWEDDTEITVATETGGIATGGTLTVENDSDADCYPVITISPYATNTDFTITNNTTGESFTLGSNAFIVGAEFEVDCKNGTIYLTVGGNSVEMSSALADGGGFIKLAPGDNELEYTSSFGNADITVTFRRRYVF
jgi:hypothetical protein